MSNRSKIAGLMAATTMLVAGAANAATLSVSITNEQPADGVFLTPLASIFHDGNFDLFNAGETASQVVEGLAEEGAAGPVVAAAQAAGHQGGVVFGTGGFGSAPGQPPLIDPMETASALFNVDFGATDDLYFSFMSMILPTNDAFIGNDNPTAYQIVDSGIFQGTSISVYTNDAWDAGTEENNFQGLPFSPNGGDATDTNGVIARLGNLLFVDGQTRGAEFGPVGPAGLGDATLIATIEVAAVPLPAGLPLMLAGLGAFGIAKRRKKA